MTALIATGIGATQKPGEEVGRALRTLTMNIRSIKGETEDGIFNEETFGQAEKALSGIEIKTREIKNGVVELKTASQVIDELAQKFQAGELSAEQLSLVLENVATKRQADLLSGMVQNWNLYSKAMSDFEGASGSAASEAQKELESWQGKLNVLQNNWTAFVANFVDTGWIKTGLDGLSGLVNILDSTPGKMAVTTAGVIALVGAMKSIKDIPAIQTIGKTFQDIGKQAA